MGKKQPSEWFAVDKEGLAALVDGRGKAFILHELLQNAWDCPHVTRVDVTMETVPGKPLVALSIVDDDMNGFHDLIHAYTLFAPSSKKGDPEKRGRFNLGEKLVLSLCEEATIVSTTGSVTFSSQGRRRRKIRRKTGTEFTATLRMTRDEYEEALVEIRKVMPPRYVATTINGVELKRHECLLSWRSMLPTVVADEKGVLRTKDRSTLISLYEIEPGEVATLYEMGIPVVELEAGVPWHVAIDQKIPLTMERDNITPSYRAKLHVALLNRMADGLASDDCRATWVTSALGSPAVSDGAVKAVVSKRFGEKAVIADPSDPEGENMAKASGYTVVPGGSFPGSAWDNIKRAEALLPAGKVTPSPKPFSPDGTPITYIVREVWSSDMEGYVRLVNALAERVDIEVLVDFTMDRGWGFNAAYSPMVAGGSSGHMTVNFRRLGAAWFAPSNWQEQMKLIIHELGHHWGHHLEESYHKALCRLAAASVKLALDHPELFLTLSHKKDDEG